MRHSISKVELWSMQVVDDHLRFVKAARQKDRIANAMARGRVFGRVLAGSDGNCWLSGNRGTLPLPVPFVWQVEGSCDPRLSAPLPNDSTSALSFLRPGAAVIGSTCDTTRPRKPVRACRVSRPQALGHSLIREIETLEGTSRMDCLLWKPRAERGKATSVSKGGPFFTFSLAPLAVSILHQRTACACASPSHNSPSSRFVQAPTS